MALQKQIVPVSLAQGVDTKSDPKQVAMGKLLTLENGVFTSPGRIRKRYGQGTLISPGSSGRGVASYQDELVTWSGAALFSYSAVSNAQVNKGTLASIDVQAPNVIRNQYNQTNVDGAFHSAGVRVYAYEDSRGGVWYAAQDVVSGQVVKEAQLDANGQKPRVVVLGSYVVIFWRNTSDGKIYRAALGATNPTATLTPVQIVTTLNGGTPSWCVISDGVKAFIAWNSTTATTVSFAYLDSALTLTGPVNVAATTINAAVDLCIDPNTPSVVFAWYDGASVRFMARSYVDLSSVVAATLVENVANVLNVASTNIFPFGFGANSYQIAYTITAAATINYKVRYSNYISGSILSSQDLFRGVSLSGRPFFPNGADAIYYPVVFNTPLQPTYFLIRSDNIVVARMLGGNASARTDYVLPQSTVISGSTQWHLPLLQKDLLTTILDQTGTGDPSGPTGANRALYTQTGVTAGLINFFDSQESFSHAEQARVLHISGGQVSMYDGQNVVEHGFHYWPETPTLVAAGSGGSLSAGTYWYACTYEWTDAEGIRHESAPSIPVSAVTVANDSVTVTIPTLRLTQKAKVTCVTYRTEVNGTVFYRVSNPTSPTLNSTTADTVTFADTFADSVITAGPTLYTLGGVLENEPAPACTALTQWKTRLAALPTEGDRLSVNLSKIVSAGTPVQWSSSLVYSVDARGGRITAMGALDDKLILFKESSIFILVGNGPDDTGTQDDIGPAQLLTTDVGCTNQRSVVVTPEGLMFQTSKGIYLLNRSLQVSYVGAPVEAYNSNTVISSVLLADTNQVRFGLDTGQVLVYDYLMDQWSVFTNYSQVDAANYLDRYTVLRSDGGIRFEDPSTYTDNGHAVSLKLVTSWLQVAGLQGFQRIYRVNILGEWKSDHKLLVGLAYDFNPGLVQNDTVLPQAPDVWGSGASWGSDTVWGGPDPLYQYQIHCARQKCQAIQITVQDASTTGESMNLSALTFLVGVKSGLTKTPAARQYG